MPKETITVGGTESHDMRDVHKLVLQWGELQDYIELVDVPWSSDQPSVYYFLTIDEAQHLQSALRRAVTKMQRSEVTVTEGEYIVTGSAVANLTEEQWDKLR